MPLAPRSRRPGHRRALAAVVACIALASSEAPASTRAATPRVHAIVNARIVPAPGQVIPRGTVVVRDGVIAAVGANVAVPPDARVWEGDSLTVYAGLIDPFVLASERAGEATRRPAGPGGGPPRPGPQPEESRGAAHELAVVRPETRVIEGEALNKDALEALRAAGFTVAQVVPRTGVLRGQSAVLGLGAPGANRSVVRADAAQVIAIQAAGQMYPGSLMGAVAVIRQSFLDARWYRDVQAAYAKRPAGRERPATNVSWAALEPVIANRQPALFVADEMLEVLRAAAIAREAGLTNVQVTGAGDEYKRVAAIAATKLPLYVPVNFPDVPDVTDDADALEIETEQLRYWNEAPGNPAALATAGVRFAFTANGLKEVKNFRANVAKAIERGLARDRALAAVTTEPAALLGLGDRLGTIAVGRIANLTVTRGELFAEKSTVREVWVDGDRYEVAKDETSPKGTWTLQNAGAFSTLIVATDPDTTVKLVAPGADTVRADSVRLDGSRLRFRVGPAGALIPRFDLTARNDALRGTMTTPGQLATHVTGVTARDAKDEKKKPPEPPLESPRVAGNSEAWRAEKPAQPAVVLVRNATVWTAGPKGTLQNADVLVRAGKISAVGPSLSAPSNAVVIDGAGKHVLPGVIDEHSHAAVLGNVNECTNSNTGEVRIQDVVNSESVNIYRQLAGGTTIMHLLHGSCNSIGGQAAIIKNKWGALPDELLMANVQPSIKFALGENVKQSNWGVEATGRYPQSRAGVEQFIRGEFQAARDYRAAQQDFKGGRRPYPPRPELRLDAVLEVLDGKRDIHCHSYRQDEILMLMRVAEEFDTRVPVFTHILEGYKVADEMASHGAGAGSFSDWWQYKQEVIDAIPWNGYLMWDRGVTVAFNSDSDELARRLNTEAAKAIKYGGVPADEAIKFCTLNAAKLLKIDDRVGSLEPGKDADFSIWNGSPLSPLSRCEQTWIEGRKYFDREADLAGREALERERAELIARARAAKKAGGEKKGDRGNWPPRYLEETDLGGNACGHEGDQLPFVSEATRRELRNAEVQR